jgi:hypothetical protein
MAPVLEVRCQKNRCCSTSRQPTVWLVS